ncbi:uncharacterized protein METZ01_LOCUS237587, partial [marine metagenome]
RRPRFAGEGSGSRPCCSRIRAPAACRAQLYGSARRPFAGGI